MAEKKKELTMDEAYAQLQAVLEKMESGDLGLEESFKLYEEGLGLVKLCSSKLDEIEKKMIILENRTEENEDA
ncbi:MAG: exodeoxyribonuclease VII small subunit [Lachnospiraceae bacterium]|nr:exodeoxyribonuclease VII small subunit [Lachnospiraceae bacterium]